MVSVASTWCRGCCRFKLVDRHHRYRHKADDLHYTTSVSQNILSRMFRFQRDMDGVEFSWCRGCYRLKPADRHHRFRPRADDLHYATSVSQNILSRVGAASNQQTVIIDTDPGIDDAVAIFTALGDPNIKVMAITCARGNADVHQVVVNTLKLLSVSMNTNNDGKFRVRNEYCAKLRRLGTEGIYRLLVMTDEPLLNTDNPENISQK
ncbi:hypothetical protein J6590_012328 [Homalodisca vitripennis]|nr:hypothetical protein J6590_012328 [Homalodisca vitripennis]